MEKTESKVEKESTKSKFDSKKYEARLQALHKIDPLYPAFLAARNALRVLPLIAIEGHLDFWIESPENLSSGVKTKRTKGPSKKSSTTTSSQKRGMADENLGADKRAVNLLTIFLASQYLIQQFAIEHVKRDYTKIVASASAVSGSAVSAASANDAFASAAYDASASSAYAAFISGTLVSDDKRASETVTENTAVDSASAAAAYALTATDNLKELTEMMDLEVAQAEEGGSTKIEWLTRPLWKSAIPERLMNIYQKKFIPLVNELVEQNLSLAPEVAEALTRLLTNYNALVTDQTPISKTEYHHSGGIAPESSHQVDDQLGRQKLVNSLTKLLTYKDNTEHMTIGLLGHWGTGKTRILELLKDKIKSTTHAGDYNGSGFLFGEFNAWAYEHAKNNQAAMAHEVIKSLTSFQHIDAIKKDTPWTKKCWYSISNSGRQLLWKMFIRSRITFGFMARKYTFRLVMFSVWLCVLFAAVSYYFTHGINLADISDLSKDSLLQLGVPLSGLFGLWRIVNDAKVLFAQPYTKELLSYIKLPNYASQIGEISEMREDIRLMANIRLGTQEPDCKDWLGKILPSKRLLFVVDDLDRCGPEGIVRTFEAIRLVLDIPQVYVVIAVDQRIALAALALHYEKLREHHQLNDAKAIARDYLAKMIQLPIVVDDGDKETLEGYLSHLWQDEEQDKDKWLGMLNTNDYEDTLPRKKVKPEVPKLPEGPQNIAPGHETDSKPLSDKEIVEQVLSLPEITSKKVIEEFTGLQPEHKAAFAYWAGRFEITNARQIKRLYNSYNLIRLVSGYEDQLCEGTTESFAYGVLVALLAIEAVNSIENASKRKDYGKFLKVGLGAEKTDKESRPVLSAARTIIELAAQQRFEHLDENKRYEALLNSVELFVLPAIDSFDVDDEVVSDG